MKHVFPTAEIFHLFAHKRRDDIRNPQGNVHIDGDTLYSYHLAIAKHLPTATLIHSASNSNTTNKHLSLARRAMTGRVVYVKEVNDDPVGTLLEEAKEHIADAAKPRIADRTRAKHWEYAAKLLADARFLNPKAKLPLLPEDPDKATVQAFASKLLRADYRAKAKNSTERATNLARMATGLITANTWELEVAIDRAADARSIAAEAIHATAMAGLKTVPKAMVKLQAEMQTLRATLTTRLEDAQRETLLTRFDEMLAAGRLRDAKRLLDNVADPEREARLQAAIAAHDAEHIARLADILTAMETTGVTRALLDATGTNHVMGPIPADLAERWVALHPAINAFHHQEAAEAIADWRAGGSRYAPHGIGPLLRIANGEIETSWGARVPLSIAPMVWQAATFARKTNTATDLPSPRPQLGHYTLDRINADGSIVAGCHTIAFAELELIARQLEYIA